MRERKQLRLSELPLPPDNRSGWPWTEESNPLPNNCLWPRVSIVTPSFNQGQYLEETIRSVLLQGYPDLEYIIIDGGSSDESLDIIRKYQSWLSYWVSEPDRGQTHAINKGWVKSTGEILAYINADDYYLRGAIASAVQGFQSNPTAGMIYGSATVVDETGNPIRVWVGRAFNPKLMLTKGNIVPQPAAFFSGEILKKAGYVDEKWNMIMDFELCIRIGMQSPTVCLPLTLASFRDHGQSKTNTRFEVTAGELIQFLSTFYPEQIPPKELREIKREALSRIHYEWALACLAHERRKPSAAFRQLVKSAVQNPLFTMKHLMGAAYITKEVLLRYFGEMYTRLSYKNSEWPGSAD